MDSEPITDEPPTADSEVTSNRCTEGAEVLEKFAYQSFVLT